MSNVAVSFASLVKSNNGMFKSEAQAKFLLSQCQEENTFFVGGQVYNNSYTLQYNCDSLGVVSVEKYLPKSGKTTTTWERLTVEQFQAKQAQDVATKELNVQREANTKAKYQGRIDAFQVALEIAQDVVAKAANVPVEVIKTVLKDVDGINNAMTVLVQDAEFVKAWEAYNNEPGV